MLTGCQPANRLEYTGTQIIKEGETYQADGPSDIEVYVRLKVADFLDGDLTVYLPPGAEDVDLVRLPKADWACKSYVEFREGENLHSWSLCVAVDGLAVAEVRDIFIKTR